MFTKINFCFLRWYSYLTLTTLTSCFHLCPFVWLVGRISQNLLNEFPQNLYGGRV